MENPSSNRIERVPRRESEPRESARNQNTALDSAAPRSLSHRFKKPEEFSTQRSRSRSTSPEGYSFQKEVTSREQYTSKEQHASREEQYILKESSRHPRTSEARARKDFNGRNSSLTEDPPPTYSSALFPREDRASRHAPQPLQEQQEMERHPRDSQSKISSEDRHTSIRTQGRDHKDSPRKDSHKQRRQNQSPDESLRKAPSLLTKLPQRFASRLSGTLAWTAQDLVSRRDNIIVRLSQQDNVEIHKALRRFLGNFRVLHHVVGLIIAR